MSHHRLRSIAAIVFATGLLSCSGDDPVQPENDGGGITELTLVITTTSAKPGALVPIDGIPANIDLDGAHLIVRDAGTTTRAGVQAQVETLTMLGRDENGAPYFVAPLRPGAPARGGAIKLRIAGSSLKSNWVPFTVDSLPVATSTVGDMVGNLQVLMDSWLEVRGITREELRAMDPKSMPAWMYPLWHAHEILDSPDNPHSLRAAVDGPVAFFNNETIDFDVTDRLLSGSGFNELLVADIASIDSLPRLDTLMVDPSAPASSPAPTRTRSTLTCNVPAADYDINTASELDIVMAQSRAALGRLEAGGALTNAGYVISAVGVVPAAKPAATVLSGSIYVYKLLNDAAARLLPTQFDNGGSDFELADDDFTYNEDDEGGFWKNFRVEAISEGWRLDEAALNALLRLAKIYIGFPVGEYTSEFEDNLANFVVTQATKAWYGVITDGSSFLEVCPGRWPITDPGMSSSLFCVSEIVSGTSFKMSSHTFFETDAPGVSQLQVKTAPGRFGDAAPALAIKDIEVIAIEVVINPGSATMKDDEKRSFDAVVKNASDDTVEWTVPPPLQEVALTNFGKTIEVMAPPKGTNWNQVILRARSQAKTGSREGRVDSDPRDGVAGITHQDSVRITISPTYACVMNGRDTTFTATVTPPGEYTIVWAKEQGFGTISQNGTYTAPSIGTTDVVISATVEEYPYAKVTANVRVGACNCEFVIETTGLYIRGGDVAYIYTDLPGDFDTYTFYYELQEYGAPPGVIFGMTLGPTKDGPGPAPGQTGRFAIGVSYLDGTQAWTTNDSTAVVEITITEHTATYMVGTFSGFLGLGGGDDVRIGVYGEVRAARFVSGQGWPCR